MTFERKDTQWVDPNHAKEKSPSKGNLMTDKRKDEMPDEIWAWGIDCPRGWAKDKDWMGFDERKHIKYHRSNLSTPVPDDVAVKALAKFDQCKSTLLNGSVQSYLIPLQHVETIRAAILRAASTPSAEVGALMEKLEIQEAANGIVGMKYQRMSKEVQELRDALAELLEIVDKYTPCQGGSSFINAKKFLGEK